MKKLILLIIILVSMTSIYPVDLSTSIGVKSSTIEAPMYAELSLNQSFDVLRMFATYQLGYDIMNNIGYNDIIFGASLSFNWGDIILSKEYGNNVNKTEFRLEF